MRFFLPVALLGLVIASCDRNVEPYVEGEEPREPNLARIFPEGAEAPGPGLRGSNASGEMPAPRTEPPAAGAPATGAEIQGTLELAAGLAGAVPPQATLFLIARRDGAAGGPPLAVRRIAGPSFPMAFTIGPQHVMIQGMPFSGPIRLTARLDGDGDAMTREPGDLSGAAADPVAPGARDVRIVFEERL
jgi:hypothetical protein